MGRAKILGKPRGYNAPMERSLIVLLACLTGCAMKSGQAPASSASALLGQPSPALMTRALQGQRLSPDDTLGRTTVIKFFADYCVPCRQSMPALVKLRKKYPRIAFVGVSMDEDPATALTQVQRYGLNFPVLHDAGRVMAGRFRVTYLPVVFVIDSMGRVSWVGGPEQAHDALNKVLARTRHNQSSK